MIYCVISPCGRSSGLGSFRDNLIKPTYLPRDLCSLIREGTEPQSARQIAYSEWGNRRLAPASVPLVSAQQESRVTD